jgi:regulator of sirC expression with transglutaminase-like and TPR domain
MAADRTALVVNGIPTLAEICESPDDFLGKRDVGELNAICALGLPGAENLDVAATVAWLDEAARQVDWQIRARYDKFAQNPMVYNNSFGAFYCNYLLRTLQELYGVQYNPKRITDSDFQDPLCINPDFSDSRDLFIHGILNGPGGTCASMPVMYVAVGRRMGCPFKLVEAPGHLFFRWEDSDGQRFNVPETFNVEGTGPGMGFYPDDFYRTWPREWKPYEKTGGWYLRSMSPIEEFASFLATRGACLESNGRIEEAVQAFKWASKLLPDDLRYESKYVKLLKLSYEEARKALDSERRMLDTERMMLDQQQRRVVNDPFRTNGLGHIDSCQCAQCRQVRQPVHQVAGHPPGCGCVNCLRLTQNPHW